MTNPNSRTRRATVSMLGACGATAIPILTVLSAACAVVTAPSSEDAADSGPGTPDATLADGLDATPIDSGPLGWGPVTSLPTPRYAHSAVVHGQHIFVIGGVTGGTQTTNEVWSAPVLDDGQLGSWSATTVLPARRAAHASVAANGYVYVLGGADEVTGQFADVLYARLGTDGTVGPWRTTTPLPTPRMEFGAAVWAGRVYVVAGNYGEAGVNWRDVLVASLAADGSVGSWTMIASLPTELTTHAVAALDGRLYVLGGAVTNQGFVDSVRSAAILGDGSLSGWRDESGLPTPCGDAASVVVDGRPYLVGGAALANVAFDQVLAAKMGPDAMITSWDALLPLPAPRFSLAAAAVDGRLYAIGGRSSDPGGAPSADVHMIELGVGPQPAPAPAMREARTSGCDHVTTSEH